MSARTVFGLTAILLAAAVHPARAHGPVPQAFRSLKPHQVVEQIMALREVLSLSDQQFARLDDLSIAIRNDKHRWTHRGGKPHETRHVPMVTQQQAYDKAMEELTPDQRIRIEAIFFVTSQPLQRAPRKLTVPHGKP